MFSSRVIKHIAGLLISALVALILWYVVASLSQLDVDWSDGERVGGVRHGIASTFRVVGAPLVVPFIWTSSLRPAEFHPVLVYSIYCLFWSPIFYGLYLWTARRRRQRRSPSGPNT